jgi:hypothetical protein
MVKLAGERFDLEEFPRLFRSVSVYTVDERDDVFLVGEQFESFTEATAVFSCASDALIRMFAAASVLGRTASSRDLLTAQAVVREQTHSAGSAVTACREDIDVQASTGAYQGVSLHADIARALAGAMLMSPRHQLPDARPKPEPLPLPTPVPEPSPDPPPTDPIPPILPGTERR